MDPIDNLFKKTAVICEKCNQLTVMDNLNGMLICKNGHYIVPEPIGNIKLIRINNVPFKGRHVQHGKTY